MTMTETPTHYACTRQQRDGTAQKVNSGLPEIAVIAHATTMYMATEKIPTLQEFLQAQGLHRE